MKLLVISLIACFSIMSGCILETRLPPSASLGPPANLFGPVERNAWLMKVEITDVALGDKETRASLKDTLTNNLLRFLREGSYFRRVELFPGKVQADDYVLQFRFDRYQHTRKEQLAGVPSYRIPWEPPDPRNTSDLSATLTITTSDGQLVKEVSSSIKDEHTFRSGSMEIMNGWRVRTAIMEDLLGKALHETNPAP